MEFQHLLELNRFPITNNNRVPIRFVHQSRNCVPFEQQYEPRIYLYGEVQTRLQSWHDFFQVLVWKTFPKSKSVINAIHYQASSARLTNDSPLKQRSQEENMLTLFDECGIVIVSCEADLLELIRNFQWETLFWTNREKFNHRIKCFTFGHAMYEKALSPYIGMTANALLIHVDRSFFSQELDPALHSIDQRISATLLTAQDENSLSPKLLTPFPLLGVPGWHESNSSIKFYKNENYFRKGRRKKKNILV